MTQDTFLRRARALSWTACATLIALPVLAVMSLWQGGLSETQLRAQYSDIEFGAAPGEAALLLFQIEAAICFGLVLWTVYLLYEWLQGCAAGDALAPDTANYARRLGLPLMALAALNIVGNTAIILALTWGNAPGTRSFTVGIDGADLMLVLAAGILTLFGWIQHEAARLRRENDGFV